MENDFLVHVSEQSDIREFIPRVVPSNSGTRLEGKFVWAIDKYHLANYLLPRDCPRVTYSIKPTTTLDDKVFFFNGINESRIIAVEKSWLNTIKKTKLYLYSFNIDGFQCIDQGAGYWVSENKVLPLKVTLVDDLISTLKLYNGHLKILENLWDLHDKVANSSLEFSCIRMRNASTR